MKFKIILGLLVLLVAIFVGAYLPSVNSNGNNDLSNKDNSSSEKMNSHIEKKDTRLRQRQTKLEKYREKFKNHPYFKRHEPKVVAISSDQHLEKIKKNLKQMPLLFRSNSKAISDIHSAFKEMALVIRSPSRETTPHCYYEINGWIYIWGGESDTPTHGYAVEKAKGKFYKWHLYKEKEAKRLLSGDSSYFFPLESEK